MESQHHGNNMEDQLFATIAEGIHRREYSLLLGAGASIGSLGGDDEPLPSGPQLRDTFVNDFRIPDQRPQIDLQRAYAAAKRKDPQQLEQFLRKRFTNCKPAWHHLIAEMDWHRIWTLNIDDTVEQAYIARGTDFDRFDWTSSFRDTAVSDRQIIHLHGFARDPLEEEPSESDVVFSMAEYASTLGNSRAWHTVFNDEFAERPTVIIGATLVDEFDLQQALQNSGSTAARGFPSVIVLNEFSELEREELLEYGLIPIESDATIFARRIHQAVIDYRESIADYYSHDIDAQTARFLQQFIDLRRYSPQSSKATRHFYEGYEPHWRNILDDDDAVLDVTETCLSHLRETLAVGGAQQSVHVLTGIRGTGKTTGLLRVARELVGYGLFVFLFRGDEHLDIDATIEWLRRSPRTVLVFNDCGDFATPLGVLAEKCSVRAVNLVVLASARSTRIRLIEQKIDRQYLRLSDDYRYSSLSNHDIDASCGKTGESTAARAHNQI